MKTYHMNDKGEIRPCKSPDNCRFTPVDAPSNNNTSSDANLEKRYPTHKKLTRKNVKPAENSDVNVTEVHSVVSDDAFRATTTNSTIDVLTEKPSKEFLKDLRNGKYQDLISFSRK